jgi:hypothetical protein
VDEEVFRVRGEVLKGLEVVSQGGRRELDCGAIGNRMAWRQS